MYGARFINWRVIEIYSSDYYIRGLLHLGHREKSGKITPQVLLKRCLISDTVLPESYFDRFCFIKFQIIKNNKETWKDIERYVYEKIKTNTDESFWVSGKTLDGISLSLELQHWNLLYQSFLNKRTNGKN